MDTIILLERALGRTRRSRGKFQETFASGLLSLSVCSNGYNCVIKPTNRYVAIFTEGEIASVQYARPSKVYKVKNTGKVCYPRG